MVQVTGAPNNILFPAFRQHRKAGCQGERHRVSELRLIDQLNRIKDGLEAGMTRADIQHEADAQQAERVIEHWVRNLAANPRRGPSEAASLLSAWADRLNGEVES
jgi:hypothetical protein